MSLPVIWAPSAQDEFVELLEFLENQFGLDAALKVLERTGQIIDGIVDFPEIFPTSSERKDLRKAVINKNASLLYRILTDKIEILHVWDNRQNPNTLLYLI